MDNHVRPQADMLLWSDKLVPKFIGRMEHMSDHWQRLRRRMKQEGLPTLGDLPLKNVRRDGRSDIRKLFNTSNLVNKVLERYEQDFNLFYSDYSVEELLNGDGLKKLPPLQRKSKQFNPKQQIETKA